MAYELLMRSRVCNPPHETGTPQLLYNFQHDLESLWWIALWVILVRIGQEASQLYARTIYISRLICTPERGGCILSGRISGSRFGKGAIPRSLSICSGPGEMSYGVEEGLLVPRTGREGRRPQQLRQDLFRGWGQFARVFQDCTEHAKSPKSNRRLFAASIWSFLQ